MYSPVYFRIGDVGTVPFIAIMCTVLWYNMHSPIGILCSHIYRSLSPMV